jgi:hypothetical protein
MTGATLCIVGRGGQPISSRSTCAPARRRISATIPTLGGLARVALGRILKSQDAGSTDSRLGYLSGDATRAYHCDKPRKGRRARRHCSKLNPERITLVTGLGPGEPIDRDTELSRLIGKVFLDTRGREDDKRDRHDRQHLIVAFEGRCLVVLGPVWFEGDLRDLALVGLVGCDFLGVFRRAAVHQHHVRGAWRGSGRAWLRSSRGRRYLHLRRRPSAWRTAELGLGAPCGGEEIAAVDHCGVKVAMVDHRSGPRSPARAGVSLVVLGGRCAVHPMVRCIQADVTMAAACRHLVSPYAASLMKRAAPSGAR